MNITLRTAMEIIAHEGLVRQAYKDSVGVWTWSIGITSASGHKVERYKDNPQPLSKCLDIFLWVLERNYARTVREVFKGHELTEHQFAAALSFHYNTGAIARATWVKKWKAGDIAGARKSFMDWRKPSELIPRRHAERDLFFDGKWSSDGTVTEYTELTSKHTPRWSSARKVDAEPILRELLGEPEPVPFPEPSVAEPRGSGWTIPVLILCAGVLFVALAFTF